MSEEVKKNMGFIPELTGLRGLAALLIVINHLTIVLPSLNQTVLPGGTKLSYLTWLCGVGGMSLFFILSGIVIFYTYSERMLSAPAAGIKTFFVARFARLYPLYFTFIVFFFCWNLKLCPEQLGANLTSLPMFLAGMQSWVYGYIGGTELIYLQGSANISWSISTEFALYFFFVPFVFLLGKSSLAKALTLFASSFILGIAFIYSVCHYGCLTEWLANTYPGHGGAHFVYLTYHSPYGRVFEFMAGWSIAMLYKDHGRRSPRMLVASLLAWAGAAVLAWLMAFNVVDGWSHTFMSPCLMLFCFGLPYFGSRILQCRLLMFLGDVSYSAYLLHIIFVVLLRYEGNELHQGILTLIKFIAFTYVVAWVSYRYFETPVRRKIRSMIK